MLLKYKYATDTPKSDLDELIITLHMTQFQNSSLVEESIAQKIYFVRSKKIMLDRDLAVLYGVKAIR